MWHLIFAKKSIYIFLAHVTFIFAYTFFYGSHVSAGGERIKNTLDRFGSRTSDPEDKNSHVQPTTLTYLFVKFKG
jgi:hypothetical protein